MSTHPLKLHIEEVSPITEDEFSFVLEHFVPLTRRRHQYIVQEGEPVNKEFWVVKGCVRSYVVDQSGKEHILQFGLENWWVSDYDAFTNRRAARLSVDCLEDTELLYITYENKEKLSAALPLMAHFWSHKTNLGYGALQNRILSLLKNTARERYDLLFAQYPQLFQRVPKKLLAAYLGVSRETLSRFQN